MLHVLFADSRLLREAVKLRAEHRGLKLAEAIVESHDAVMELICEASTPGVDIALYNFHVLEIVADDRATFAGRDQLAGLKAEGAQIAHGARAFSFPHAAVGVRAVLHHFYVVFGGDAK